MSDIYKYRVGKKWYSFDKSILEPEDLRVFNLADWKDKLKIITIYQELKPSDNDDVVILKTKTEKPNKDKRAAEYRTKKQKLESELTEQNKNNTPEGEANRERLIKELKQLDIEYADIVNIQNAETVNIARANQVILKDVNELIKETNDKLKELKPSLTSVDFEIINGLIENLLEANNNTTLNDTITAIKNALEDITKNSLNATVKEGVDTMSSLIDELKITLNEVPDNDTFNKVIETGIFGKFNKNTVSKMKKYAIVLTLINKHNITDDDLKLLSEYPLLVPTLKRLFGNLRLTHVHQMCEMIRFYNLWYKNFIDDNITIITISTSDNITSGWNYLSGNLKDEDKFKIEFNSFNFDSNNFKKYYLYTSTTNAESKNPKHTKQQAFNLNIGKNPDSYEIIKTIVDNEQIEEEDKTGAAEKADGFLGLKTNKAAKKEYEQLMDEITKLKQQVEQMGNEIRELKTNVKTSNESTQRRAKDIFDVELKESDPIPLSEPTISNDTKVVKPKFLTDITQGNTQLKHIEPQPKAPELTDLEKLLNRRRQDIEPDLTDSEDSEDWGAGVGGLLGELQRDLNKYGLVLSLSPDKNAYFINVFNRKQKKANGVAEASKLVNSVNQDTEYKDLKKLYEQLY